MFASQTKFYVDILVVTPNPLNNSIVVVVIVIAIRVSCNTDNPNSSLPPLARNPTLQPFPDENTVSRFSCPSVNCKQSMNHL